MEEKAVEIKNETDEISLKELSVKVGEWYRYILSKWMTILAFGILGGILGYTYAWYKKPVYIATTTFVLDDEDKGGGLSQYAGLASIAGFDLGGSGGGIFQGDNILVLYKSRKMIEKTLLTEVEFNGKKQTLLEKYIEFKKLRESWAKNEKLKNIQFKTTLGPESKKNGFNRLQDSILGKIVEDISGNLLNVSKPDKKLSIIRAEVTTTNEDFSKEFNEQIVKNVNDFYIETKTKKSLESIKILQQKTDSVRSAMNGAIYSAVSIADATPNLNITRQVQRVAPVQRSQISIETNKAMLAELVKNLELSKISLRKEAPLIQVIDEPVFPLEKQSFGKLKGIIFGGIIFGFLSLITIIIKKIIKEISL